MRSIFFMVLGVTMLVSATLYFLFILHFIILDVTTIGFKNTLREWGEIALDYDTYYTIMPLWGLFLLGIFFLQSGVSLRQDWISEAWKKAEPFAETGITVFGVAFAVSIFLSITLTIASAFLKERQKQH